MRSFTENTLFDIYECFALGDSIDLEGYDVSETDEAQNCKVQIQEFLKIINETAIYNRERSNRAFEDMYEVDKDYAELLNQFAYSIDKSREFVKKLTEIISYDSKEGFSCTQEFVETVCAETISYCMNKIELDNLKKNILYKYIFTDKNLIWGMDILPSSFNLESQQIEDQYESNTKIWDSIIKANNGIILNGYIERQNLMEDLKYGVANDFVDKHLFSGKMTAGDNACEVIAVYNALVSLNGGSSPVPFPDLLRTFSYNGIVCDGVLGTSITAVNEYFIQNGYQTKMLSGKEIDLTQISDMAMDYNTFIVMKYNEYGNLTEGLHTVTITYDAKEKCYYVHNDSDYTEKNNSSTYTLHAYYSLWTVINAFYDNEENPLCIIGIQAR